MASSSGGGHGGAGDRWVTPEMVPSGKSPEGESPAGSAAAGGEDIAAEHGGPARDTNHGIGFVFDIIVVLLKRCVGDF